MTEEFAIKLEKLYQQIEDESYEIAKVFTGSPDAPGKPIINSTRKEFYKKGATPYAEKWLESKQTKDRYEKALKEIQSHIKSAHNTSSSVNEMAIALIIAEALTP